MAYEMAYTEEELRNYLRLRINDGMLKEVPHGYCFDCNSEKPVLEVVDRPEQPPICFECLVTGTMIQQLKRVINGE